MNVNTVARLRSLIDQYMASRRQPSIISTKAAAVAISTYLAPCPLRGRAVEDAIALSAVRHGHAVAFDMTEHRVQHASAKHWKARRTSSIRLSPAWDAVLRKRLAMTTD
jgi:hypothetical protein